MIYFILIVIFILIGIGFVSNSVNDKKTNVDIDENKVNDNTTLTTINPVLVSNKTIKSTTTNKRVLRKKCKYCENYVSSEYDVTCDFHQIELGMYR